MFNGVDSVAFRNIDSTTELFALRGGRYAVEIVADWQGGSVTLARLAADGATAVPVHTAFTADSYAVIDLPAGDYCFVIDTAQAVFAEIIGIAVPQ